MSGKDVADLNLEKKKRKRERKKEEEKRIEKKSSGNFVGNN